MTSSERLPYIDTQKRYFDERVKVFCQPIPTEIEKKTDKIVVLSGLSDSSKVLDVGCGVGVLEKHFLDHGVLAANIVGCDLSDEMLSIAKSRYPDIFFWQGDVVDLKSKFSSIPGHITRFDNVFFNACFGNMWDQCLTLKSSFELLAPGGGVVLSHPLGSRFVEALKVSDPDIVPHSLPNEDTLKDWSKEISFEINEFISERDFYYVYLKRL